MNRPDAWRPHVALALLLAAAGLSGCSALRLSRHASMPAAPRQRGADAHAAAAAPARDDRDPYWSYVSAERHVAADSLVMAESELRQALALDPTYAPALALLSKLEFQSGRHADAVTLLEPVRLQPDAYAPEARVRLLAGLALHEDALGASDRVREVMAPVMDAGSRPVASVPVYVALRGETPDAAAPLAQEAAHRDGHSAVNQNNLGITRLRAGDVDGARKAFAQAIARDASLPGPYYNLTILEKYYRFDDAAAARWFAAYWDHSHDDPDGLRAVFPMAQPDSSNTGGRP